MCVCECGCIMSIWCMSECECLCCLWVWVHVWGRKTLLSFFTFHLVWDSFCSHGADLHPVSASHRRTGITDTYHCTHCYVSSGDLCSGPHAFTESVFTHWTVFSLDNPIFTLLFPLDNINPGIKFGVSVWGVSVGMGACVSVNVGTCMSVWCVPECGCLCCLWVWVHVVSASALIILNLSYMHQCFPVWLCTTCMPPLHFFRFFCSLTESRIWNSLYKKWARHSGSWNSGKGGRITASPRGWRDGSTTRVQSSGPAWWEERMDFPKLTSEPHLCMIRHNTCCLHRGLVYFPAPTSGGL